MQIDWLYGLIGGLLIGTGGAIYLLFNGRIMGASGILGELVEGTAGSTVWERSVFLFGTALLPLLILAVTGPVASSVTADTALLVVGGLLVGFGTRLANGCTSGHGVCGISRLSPRGIVSTIFYIGAGAATLSLARHIWGII